MNYMNLRKFSPLGSAHPAVTKPMTCPACDQHFKEGDVTTLVELGPGNNPEAQRLARSGQAYTAVASIVHWACATGEEE